jgi:hypothetical protein
MHLAFSTGNARMAHKLLEAGAGPFLRAPLLCCRSPVPLLPAFAPRPPYLFVLPAIGGVVGVVGFLLLSLLRLLFPLILIVVLLLLLWLLLML